MVVVIDQEVMQCMLVLVLVLDMPRGRCILCLARIIYRGRPTLFFSNLAVHSCVGKPIS